MLTQNLFVGDLIPRRYILGCTPAQLCNFLFFFFKFSAAKLTAYLLAVPMVRVNAASVGYTHDKRSIAFAVSVQILFPCRLALRCLRAQTTVHYVIYTTLILLLIVCF